MNKGVDGLNVLHLLGWGSVPTILILFYRLDSPLLIDGRV